MSIGATLVPRFFTEEGAHPYDFVTWENRDVVIKGKDGVPVFEACDVVFPASWSQRAADITASKYFRVVGESARTSVKQMISRVVNTIASLGSGGWVFPGG